MFAQGPRPVRRRPLGPQDADAHPGPRPGRDLPALLRRGRRLAALGLGDQGAPRVRDGPAREADPKGIDLFFNTFCAGTTRTFFEGVKSIPPGHYLRVRDGRVELKKYWDLDFPDAGQERRLDDPTPLVDELEHLMRQAVERRLRGDVPVVSYISGGLDSTVVLGLSSRERGYAVPSFTIGLDRAGPDERTQRDGIGRGPRLAADDRDHEPRPTSWRPIPS